MNHWDVFAFDNIAKSYMTRSEREIDRKTTISQSVSDRAREVASSLGIDILSSVAEFADIDFD